MGETLRKNLEHRFGCEVVAISHNLSNRPKLRADIAEAIEKYRPTTLLTEVKAAAIDVATALCIEAGLRVVYADNVPLEIEGEKKLADEILKVADMAVERFRAKVKK
jgi:cyclic 2,3-diphosphoglycerate synthetase